MRTEKGKNTMRTDEELLYIELMKLPQLMRYRMNQVEKRGSDTIGCEGHGCHKPGKMAIRNPETAERFATNAETEGKMATNAETAGRRSFSGRVLSRERVLPILLAQEEGVRQKRIAEDLRINPSSMSEFIDLLEKDGYIERKNDPADKRATLVFLTEKGRARTREMEEEKTERYGRLFGNLTDDEKKELLRLLKKVAEG